MSKIIRISNSGEVSVEMCDSEDALQLASKHDIRVLTKRIHDLHEHLIRGIQAILTAIQEGSTMVSQQLANLQAKVEQNNSVIDSAVTLLNGLSQQLRDIKDDPAAIQALADQLDSKDTELATAITTNTPAATP